MRGMVNLRGGERGVEKGHSKPFEIFEKEKTDEGEGHEDGEEDGLWIIDSQELKIDNFTLPLQFLQFLHLDRSHPIGHSQIQWRFLCRIHPAVDGVWTFRLEFYIV